MVSIETFTTTMSRHWSQEFDNVPSPELGSLIRDAVRDIVADPSA